MEHLAVPPLPALLWHNIRVTARSRSYLEYPVCEELRPHVDCLWSSGDARPPAGVSYPILPDGCVDIVFRFRTSAKWVDPLGPRASLEELLIVGPMTRALWMAQDPTQAWMGARFRPGCAYSFLKTQLSALMDLRPAADQLLNGRTVAALRRTGEMCSMTDRLRLLEEALLAMKRREETAPDHVVHGLQWIEAAGGAARIEDLCSDFGISRQHLSREFAKHVGLSPKALSRILRFREVMRRVRHEAAPNWADLAVELGYYDQAHLIAEFSGFSGISPTRYHRFIHAPNRVNSPLEHPSPAEALSVWTQARLPARLSVSAGSRDRSLAR